MTSLLQVATWVCTVLAVTIAIVRMSALDRMGPETHAGIRWATVFEMSGAFVLAASALIVADEAARLTSAASMCLLLAGVVLHHLNDRRNRKRHSYDEDGSDGS